ncbi:ABC transporter ATP-binding protein [Mesorhizobium sp. Root554]|uniref:ABC transporter ATP-binding protein n=1 Tax=unclassified Mesorhizobium TaxID=325217 RepID=UPI0006FCE0C6|nr:MULTISPECIES: ABC transporter ATP-binding protein [unclassified Mesorhizobium]KQZ15121.1 ABC transporter ATP-binding protein [Mesorhizobium sp. Root1471]KQZ37630.1 ABC transporter ATP-binding protein [Mesorhizobium sp. Root554]
MPRINLRGVDKSYGSNSANAVANLNLEIGDGEFMCLLGPSGCGKTTTLRMIAGLEHLSDGEIQVGSRIVDSVGQGIFIPPEKRQMGLVFQSYALWPHLTIERNTDFGLRLRNMPKAEREQRVSDVMKTLGIEQYRDRYPSQLSGGQQQRVALARMLAVNPEVLLLDEPLSNLDAALRLEMRAELKRLHNEFKTTIVFVTHDQWEAMTLATTIAVMSEGHLQQVGTPNDIYDRPANRFVAQFVGNPPINIVELAGKSTLSRMASDYFTARYPNLSNVGSMGIRPESLRIAGPDAPVPQGAFTGNAEVTGILPTGGSWIVELTLPGEKLFMATHQSPEMSLGDRIEFFVKAKALHVFDRQGNRLAEADRALSASEVH